MPELQPRKNPYREGDEKRLNPESLYAPCSIDMQLESFSRRDDMDRSRLRVVSRAPANGWLAGRQPGLAHAIWDKR